MEAQSLEMAVRLADEGVPLRAIARATRIPSADLRERLTEAKLDGRLLEIPHDDWPPGFPRDQRALQLSRLVANNKDLILDIQKSFGLALTGARLLLALVQHPMVPRDGKATDVHIHFLRKKLAPFGIVVTTLWGIGHQLSVIDQRKAMDLILARVAEQPAP